MLGIADARDIATGWVSSCALLDAGAVKCWASDRFGQLGNGVLEKASSPTPVHGIAGSVAISVGGYTACAVATTVECWGQGAQGQLGDGSLKGSSIPVPVKGIAAIQSLSVAFAHVCAVRRDGALFCWGDNVGSDLGNGSTNASSVPLQVAIPLVRQVSAGGLAYLRTAPCRHGVLLGGQRLREAWHRNTARLVDARAGPGSHRDRGR